MKINISKNQKLDVQMIKDFYREGDPIITESWPGIKCECDIDEVVRREYGKELEDKILSIKDKKSELLKIVDIISDILDEPWPPIDIINIYIGACPIAPRFLDNNSFLLPYYHNISMLINWSTHEMIHFLYFKKWSKLFPHHGINNYEYPDPVWALSEILVAVVGNDSRIKRLIKSDFDIYPSWKKIKFDNKDLLNIFSEIYKNSHSFDLFLRSSWEKYKKLDNKNRLTNRLTKN